MPLASQPAVGRSPLSALVALVLAAGCAQAQQDRLGRLDPFLMNPDEEVALARTAAPAGIGQAASVLVLTRTGYEMAATGTNGFVCFVGRGWSGPVTTVRDGRKVVFQSVFDRALRAPHCFNPVAAESVLEWHKLRTTLLLEGKTIAQVEAATAAALQEGKLRVPGIAAMAYMTSSRQNLGLNFGHWRPHVMLYTPYATSSHWGITEISAEFPFIGAEEGTAWAASIVPLAKFSDGSTQ